MRISFGQTNLLASQAGIVARPGCVIGTSTSGAVIYPATAAAVLPLDPDAQVPPRNVNFGPLYPAGLPPRPTGACACEGCDRSIDALMEPERQLEGYGQEEEAAALVGGTMASTANQAVPSVGRSVAIGVTTGCLIWLTTKLLDRLLFKKR